MIEIEAPEEYLCPLTLDVMHDPVMSKYGQSFERSEILQWLKSGHGVCPLSRRPLSLQDLVTNHALRMKIAEWRKENGDDDVVVVSPLTNQIYGFITLPSKDDGTDRTVDEEEDLFYLQLAALRLGQQQQAAAPVGAPTVSMSTTAAPVRRTRRRAQRRNSTGSQAGTRRSRRRPLQGLRSLFAGGPSP